METIHNREAWNKGKLVGQKPPLKLKDIWAIRIHLQNRHAVRDLAMFNLATGASKHVGNSQPGSERGTDRSAGVLSQAKRQLPTSSARSTRIAQVVAFFAG